MKGKICVGIPENQELIESGVVEKQLRDNTGKSWKYKNSTHTKVMLVNYPVGTIFLKRGSLIEIYQPDGWESLI